MAKKQQYLTALAKLEKMVDEMRANGGASGDAWTRRVAWAAEELVAAARRFPHLP